MPSRLIYTGKVGMFQKKSPHKIISSVNETNDNSLHRRYLRKDRGKYKPCMITQQKGSWSAWFMAAHQP